MRSLNAVTGALPWRPGSVGVQWGLVTGSVQKHPLGPNRTSGPPAQEGSRGMWMSGPQVPRTEGGSLPAAEARDWRHCRRALLSAQGPAAPLTRSEPGSAPTPRPGMGGVRGKVPILLKREPCRRTVFQSCLHGTRTSGFPRGGPAALGEGAPAQARDPPPVGAPATC